MGFSHKISQDLPEDNLSEGNRKKLRTLSKSKHIEENEILEKGGAKVTGVSDLDDVIMRLNPVSPVVPCVYLLRSSSGIQLTLDAKDVRISTVHQDDWELELVFRPVRDYNHKDLIGAHLIFVNPNRDDGGNGLVLDVRFCRRGNHYPAIVEMLFSYMEKYLSRFGDVNFS